MKRQRLSKSLKLNVGCGSSKVPGYINIDGEKSCNPDLVLDITKSFLPYQDNTVDEIIFFHCIEHIQKRLHRKVLTEFNRVLKKDGQLFISYPDFWECAKRWNGNIAGKREFWEATLYGRQLYPGDYHVCAMSSGELGVLLYECGFRNIYTVSEPVEIFNSITTAIKHGEPIPTYETVIANDMHNMIVRVG